MSITTIISALYALLALHVVLGVRMVAFPHTMKPVARWIILKRLVGVICLVAAGVIAIAIMLIPPDLA